jgi:hypothetical protein
VIEVTCDTAFLRHQSVSITILNMEFPVAAQLLIRPLTEWADPCISWGHSHLTACALNLGCIALSVGWPVGNGDFDRILSLFLFFWWNILFNHFFGRKHQRLYHDIFNEVQPRHKTWKMPVVARNSSLLCRLTCKRRVMTGGWWVMGPHRNVRLMHLIQTEIISNLH